MRIRARRAFFAGAALVILLGGCTTRDRLNPLDPANTETSGAIPGFAAVAANGIVELRWTPLTQKGVDAYALHRWRPGEPPQAIPGAVFGPASTGTIDFDVENDSTYLYRLVARFSYGDSAASLPDSATPGTRSVSILGADPASFIALSPDARDVILVDPAANAYEDFDIDRDRDVLWLSDPVAGVILRRGLSGQIGGATLQVQGVTDVSVSNLRGVGWAASPELQRVQAFGPDLNDPAPRLTVAGVGHARVVEAGTLDPSVWIGNDEGTVYRVSPSDGSVIEQWSLGASIRAIALDEATEAAWVVTIRDNVNDLYYVEPGVAAASLKRSGLDNVADVEVETATRTLWLSERGRPRSGAGRLSRLAADGSTLATRGGLEPYGIAVDAGSDHVWASDLASNRVIEFDANLSVVRRSPPLGVPYGVLIHHP
ncbi:MAG TPA: hypothetical protein VFU59_07215 [Candidatus Eisenbacteria bacterium]|nr:hypothetical protein [Candidatus Eisenbacteria bacterium]